MFYFMLNILIFYNKIRDLNINSFIVLSFYLRQNLIYDLKKKAFVRYEFDINYSGFPDWMKMIFISNSPEFLTCNFFRGFLVKGITIHLLKKCGGNFTFSESREIGRASGRQIDHI